MAITPKRVDVTSADTKQLGFEYQYLYFIVRLLQLRSGCEVGYEALDDIHVISGGTDETQYIQVKHTTELSADGTPANLTMLSEDLWKTLSNWSKLISDPAEQRDSIDSQKQFLQNSSFIFATNRNTCQNRVSELIDAVKRNACTGTNAKKASLFEISMQTTDFVEKYNANPHHSHTFYWSEYPMGATHSKELRKIDSVWTVHQYDHDKMPSSRYTPYPDMNDDNILESFIRILLNESKYK